METRRATRPPSFAMTLFSVLLPVALMLGKALVDIFIHDENQWFRVVFDVLGTPLVALLLAVIVGMFTLAAARHDARSVDEVRGIRPAARGRNHLDRRAGGGFKQVLVDSGIGTLLADWPRAHTSVILLAWCWPC